VTTSQPVRYDENIARAYLAMLSDTVADPGSAALLDLLGDASGTSGSGSALRRGTSRA
jgi:hypothetical protein